MIRLVYDHQIFQEQQYGGVSRYFFEVATRAARAKDVSASIFAPCYVNRYLRQAPRGLVVGRPFPSLEFRGSWRVRRMAQRFALAYGYRRLGDADIIHETAYSVVPFGRARRRVLTVYDMIHELFPGYFPGQDLESAYTAKREAVRRADHVICISESTRQDLIRILGVDISKTSVVYLGQSPMARGGQAHTLPSGKPFLLYVGARSGYKNFEALCAAFASSARAKAAVDLVAFGGGDFTAAERERLAKLGINGNVHHADGDDELLGTYYSAAAAFVYPSLYEGFGLPPLEAMSCGCPVVCSNTSSIPEVVGDAGRYMDPRAVDDIRAALEDVLEDSGLRERLVRAGKARVALFSWDACANQTMNIYRSLTSSGIAHEAMVRT